MHILIDWKPMRLANIQHRFVFNINSKRNTKWFDMWHSLDDNIWEVVQTFESLQTTPLQYMLWFPYVTRSCCPNIFHNCILYFVDVQSISYVSTNIPDAWLLLPVQISFHLVSHSTHRCINITNLNYYNLNHINCINCKYLWLSIW